jgi:hypothetical protein
MVLFDSSFSSYIYRSDTTGGLLKRKTALEVSSGFPSIINSPPQKQLPLELIYQLHHHLI